MFNFNELQSIHLEITSKCQASCPMCQRNVHGGLPNPNLKINEWTLDLFKTAMSPEVINQVKKIYFCGNLGDPILNNDLIEMCHYAKNINENLQIRIHTNGSARNKKWWINLANALPKDHCVVFAIDGLEDTHSIYRIGTNYNQIIENAKAFINVGGRAEWAFIRFKHNEHQVETAKATAKELGFEVFTMKDSSRFMLEKKFPVWDKNQNTIYNLEPSTYSDLKFIDKKILLNYKQIVSKTEIDCYVKKEKEIYLDANGHLLPCCWISTIPYTSIKYEGEAIPAKQDMLLQYHELVNGLGGLPKLSIATNSIKDIIDSPEYQTIWDEYWQEKKLITCARVCGKITEISNPNDQFVSRDSLSQ